MTLERGKMKKLASKGTPSAVFVGIDDIAAIIKEQIALGQSVEMPPRGRSMLPTIREGRDSVILSPKTGKLKKYDIPFYRRHDGTYVLHRVVGFDGEGYILSGDNQFILERGIGDDDVIAVVTGIRRRGRLIDVHNPIYLACVKFWHLTRLPRYLIFRILRKIKRILTKH